MGHIYLYGPPGSGKSTVGETLARCLNRPIIDLDQEIENNAGDSISRIMAKNGEPYFRDLETQVLNRLSVREKSVIALGGGTLLREPNRARVEETGVVVFLDANFQTILRRMENGIDLRPLIAGKIESKLKELLEKRAGHYKSFTLRIATDRRQPSEIAVDIERALGQFRVHGMNSGYDVLVQHGIILQIGDFLTQRQIQERLIIISDSNVSALYGKLLIEILKESDLQAEILTFPPGEKNKTLRTIELFWKKFLDFGMDRKSTIMALGGGVTGDLAGFAAATYMRGISWVGIPTSLLAMVDSSIGGKTGFDLTEGKNLIGSFHQPSLVLSDLNLLSTLPEDEFRSGMAEVVKHGIVGDPVLFEICNRGVDYVKANLSEVIRRAVSVKIKIIEADPFEKGERAALNLGHTIGHALETASAFHLRHGEAVAIGMVAEARMAELLGLAGAGLSESIAETIQGLGLPVRIPSTLVRMDILNAMQFDKKMDSGIIQFALPTEIGKIRVGVEVKNLDSIIMEI